MKHTKYFNITLLDNNNIRTGIASKIPVVVLDTKTRELFEYTSINEAARSFKAHPKTIWRKVYDNKLYLNRYQIIIKDTYNKKGDNKFYLLDKWVYYKGFKYLLKTIGSSYSIYYIFLLTLLGYVLYVFISCNLIMCIDIYNEYIVNINRIKTNHLNYILEYKLRLYDSTKELRINNGSFDKSKLGDFNYKFISINTLLNYENKNLFQPQFYREFVICQTVVNELNLDFSNTTIISINNSVYSSPIIERIDLNSTFSNIATNVVQESRNDNPLGIQGLSIRESNRNSTILNTSIALNKDKPRSVELLNYQSNILYLMINGLSPSLY